MGNPVDNNQFAKILTEQLYDVAKEEQKFQDLEDFIPSFFNVINDSDRPFEEFGQVSGLGDLPSFNGRLQTLGFSPGYTSRIEPGEFGGVVEIPRKFIDDRKFGLFEDIAQQLKRSANRVRQKNAVRLFGRINSAAFDFGSSEEGVALAGQHGTKVPGVSTTSGFNNAGTSPFSPTSLAATIILMRRFKTSIGERFQMNNDYAIVCPDSLRYKVEEVLGTDKGLYSAEGTKNVHQGRYKSMPILWLDDYSATSWGVVNVSQMKKDLVWIQRAKAEYAAEVDFMTMMTRQSCYERHGCGSRDWRFVYWHTV